MTDRKALRRELRARRRAFLAKGRPVFTVTSSVMEWLAASHCIGGYHPFADEPDPLPILAACWESDQATALPRFASRADAMAFAHWAPGDRLVASPFGFDQPGPDAQRVEPDCLLIPLVGFDQRGNRIGQGAGHYDRYLAAHRGVRKIGIAWSVQQVDAIDAEPWDVPLDLIITEMHIVSPKMEI